MAKVAADFAFVSALDTTLPLRRIGMGHCGSVWARPDATLRSDDVVLKREDGSPGRSLPNEHVVHLHLVKALRGLQPDLAPVNVPLCYGFLRASHVDVWASILPSLHPGYTPCNALFSERIPPMAKIVRQLLIDKYCPVGLQGAIAADANNDDCLVRPYLGRRRHQSSRPSRFGAFSLRNFPLHADQMEELGLDLCEYARPMAATLAAMHWCARLDAKDVEFVLASCRRPAADGATPTSDPTHMGSSMPFVAGQLGQHSMWILDFDCCRPITLDQDGVDQAVVAFFRNDPFYPLPGRPSNSGDESVWQVFRDHYLATSERLLANKKQDIQQLPARFIEQLAQREHDFRTSPMT
ncbi:zinc finger domain-containing protein [Hirsutella rhossiliensis]|uniref:Zinc finger domain-containing protein n=1 Tax=Hirsutella rhossiliensis TaxID=111463 RepID=A0A9P8SEQ2_9HYPO|nr:zinc finger domain-containing protein [Hirsutella rhossiliensis]KAH0960048.1 zinc finger domain-containing protein [Hirsutella rhossiliensis]